MRRRFRSLALAGVAAGVLLGSVPTASGGHSARPKVVEVKIIGGASGQAGKIRFSPSHIRRGTVRLEITNLDDEIHMLEINGAITRPRWLHGNGGRAKATTTFTKPGRYFATSPDAEGQGIVGLLVVT